MVGDIAQTMLCLQSWAIPAVLLSQKQVPFKPSTAGVITWHQPKQCTVQGKSFKITSNMCIKFLSPPQWLILHLQKWCLAWKMTFFLGGLPIFKGQALNFPGCVTPCHDFRACKWSPKPSFVLVWSGAYLGGFLEAILLGWHFGPSQP